MIEETLNRRRRAFALPALALPALALAATMVAAVSNGEPADPVVLTVTGEIGQQEGEGQATFDMQMLRAMPQSEIVTSTIWTDGTQVFRGVSLQDFLSEIDARGETVRISAINDYTVDVPVSDATEGAPIIAYELNGAPMAVRDKGPLWLIYPYDADESYRSEVIYARSIWQIDRIEVIGG